MSARRSVFLSAFVLCLASAAQAQQALAASPEVETHVLIVGVNNSGDLQVAPLLFADDDAARYAEMLGQGATSVTLLTLLDAESQARFPDATRQARLPTLEELDRAVQHIFGLIQAAKQQGREADFLLIYTGHGGVSEHGEGYVWLLGHRLGRAELFARLIQPSPARFNHIIVDACSAFFLLNRSDDGVRAVRALLSSASLADHPNTGALLATSRDRVTHEWTQISGGVFSHQILGALSGAADVDNDAAIRYDEIGAFVEAANDGVRDRRARIDLYLRPPLAQLSRPVWRRSPQTRPVLVLARDQVGHFSISDGRGVPVAEVNKNGEQALTIAMIGARPFSVQRGKELWQSRDTTGDELTLAGLMRVQPGLQTRSSVELALERGLYSVPFGQSYVRGYRGRLERELVVGNNAVAPEAGAVAAGVDTATLADPSAQEAGWSTMQWIGAVGLGLGGLACLGALGAAGYGVFDHSWVIAQQGEITAFEAQQHYNAVCTSCMACGVLGLTGAAVLGAGGLAFGVAGFEE